MVFSPSDVSNGVACTFALLRQADMLAGRAPLNEVQADPFGDRLARLGDLHEQAVLADYLDLYGQYDPDRGCGVYVVERPRYEESRRAAADETLRVLRSGADVVYQAVFVRSRFVGFADFIVRDRDGRYAVYDTKLARHAKPAALLQLAAYGDELIAHGIPTAPDVYLILGDRQVQRHRLSELVPVYRNMRDTLIKAVDAHLAAGAPVRWNDPAHPACGRCDVCDGEVSARRDLLMVAGMRLTQRMKLLSAGIGTIDALAASAGPVVGMRGRAVAMLRAQAALQVQQTPPPPGPEGAPQVQVFDPAGLSAIPKPDPGDIFFDFEGDPLWSDGSSADVGLEYLFGVVEVDTGRPVFRAFWAHNRREEQDALQQFLNYVAARRNAHPAMHIYHYAAYERAALQRLAGRHGTGEDILDNILRENVLVDLYGVVRRAVRVSQPSYSLKKLEPLYMGDEHRADNVNTAVSSVVAYVEYCDMVNDGQHEAADVCLKEIADYNQYDCTSTYRLRDYLLAHAAEHCVAPGSCQGGWDRRE